MLTRSEKKLFYLIQNDRVNEFASLYFGSSHLNKMTTNSEGTSFIGESVKRGALKIAELLIKDDENLPYIMDSRGNLPLAYLSIIRPNADIIDLFQNHQFPIQSPLGVKGNILHVIAPRGSIELFDKLVLSGAEMRLKNIKGEYPEDIAKRWGNAKLNDHIINHHKRFETDSFDI